MARVLRSAGGGFLGSSGRREVGAGAISVGHGKPAHRTAPASVLCSSVAQLPPGGERQTASLLWMTGSGQWARHSCSIFSSGDDHRRHQREHERPDLASNAMPWFAGNWWWWIACPGRRSPILVLALALQLAPPKHGLGENVEQRDERVAGWCGCVLRNTCYKLYYFSHLYTTHTLSFYYTFSILPLII
jgi:hypothetical protein